MKIKGLSQRQIEASARRAGRFKLANVRIEGNYTLFVLRMRDLTPPKKQRTLTNPRMKYRQKCVGCLIWGHGPEYRDAVCFHGFEAFMRECFKVNPTATIRTTRAAYFGLEDFEGKLEEE